MWSLVMDEFDFNLQIFAGMLLNWMDEDLREWENRERMKSVGLPETFGKYLSIEQDENK